MKRRARGHLLGRLAFELVVVLVGVFLAIRLQGWADERAQVRSAMATLEVVRSELLVDRTELDAVADYQTSRAGDFRLLADLLNDDPSEHHERIGRLLTEDLVPNRTWFPQSAAYETLVKTGQIVALGEVKLQVQLARLYERTYSRLVYNGELYDQAYLEEFRRSVTERWDYGAGRLFSVRPSDNRDLANVARRLAMWADAYLAVLAESAPDMDSTLVLVEQTLAHGPRVDDGIP